MSKDIIIYIHCPELVECPSHQYEAQLIDGILRDICDILKYSFVINSDRSILYFGRKIDLDYRIQKNTKTVNTVLNYSYILKDKIIACDCDITKVLDNMHLEKSFINEYTNLIKFIVKDIGDKAMKSFRSCPIQIKFADLKKHYMK